jgi:hypothetical protein
MFFEEYIHFKIVNYLSHCGVIPVQSFGSHIRPQPHGLGLKYDIICRTTKIYCMYMWFDTTLQNKKVLLCIKVTHVFYMAC